MKAVLFDLDGTLVDSEDLGTQALIDVYPIEGETIKSLQARYRGRHLESIFRDIEVRFECKLPDDIVLQYRTRMHELFDTHLQAMPGAHELLESMEHPRCIASGGPPAKIQQSLRITGLGRHFGEHVYSSYEVEMWKPAPGLFLHAAERLGVAPEECLVIEDSEPGVQAGIAAGMTVVQMAPHEDTPDFGAHHRVAALSEIRSLL